VNAAARPEPLSGAILWITALAVGAGTFMQVIDVTIANVSLATIAGNLGVSPSQAIWMTTFFQIATAVVVPLTGWVMGRYGAVKTFIGATFMFTLASFLCGLAWSLGSLVAFRILQGAACGLVMPGSQAILILIFPANRRATALSIWAFVGVVAPVFGPLLGGYISDNYHWGWIFLINVPVGMACVAICWRTLRGHETPILKLPVDVVGLTLLIVWVGAFQLVLDLGKEADWFESPEIIALTVVTAVGFGFFMIWELTEKHPIVDLSLFRNRNFSIGTFCYCIGSALIMGNVLVLPLWLQTKLGYTAMMAGLVLLPSGLAGVIITPLVNKIGGRVDVRLMATASFICLGTSYYMRARFTADADFWTFSLPLIAQGLAFAIFFVSMVTIILSGFEPARIPAASGISNFGRTAFSAFGASLTSTLWERNAAIHQNDLAGATSLYDPQIQHSLSALQDRGFSDHQSLGLLNRMLDGQAYLLSSLDIFWISTIASLIVIPLLWLTKIEKGPKERPIVVD
jgi:DHA2 family multidrug resistance protein